MPHDDIREAVVVQITDSERVSHGEGESADGEGTYVGTRSGMDGNAAARTSHYNFLEAVVVDIAHRDFVILRESG